MAAEFSADMLSPSKYGNDQLSGPISVRLPETLLKDLDAFVDKANSNGFSFVNRAFLIRDALEAYLDGG